MVRENNRHKTLPACIYPLGQAAFFFFSYLTFPSSLLPAPCLPVSSFSQPALPSTGMVMNDGRSTDNCIYFCQVAMEKEDKRRRSACLEKVMTCLTMAQWSQWVPRAQKTFPSLGGHYYLFFFLFFLLQHLTDTSTLLPLSPFLPHSPTSHRYQFYSLLDLIYATFPKNIIFTNYQIPYHPPIGLREENFHSERKE
ncbi:hypothetical protein BC939DRAFT_450155 [Gamsiella multidivaricata]|uniref:uncharacterized protein n=1 Tax=Gamsiella multidivaricata TaxID=101098 RepID=UPI00222084A9|nr:uncharacterized protein BC939DRAFT_450155 [Gamsiella multidivaricata]KAI7824357.1 hypothetical protein BC939DRAFT_450155 [Gamsiella multidivaricata]